MLIRKSVYLFSCILLFLSCDVHSTIEEKLSSEDPVFYLYLSKQHFLKNNEEVSFKVSTNSQNFVDYVTFYLNNKKLDTKKLTNISYQWKVKPELLSFNKLKGIVTLRSGDTIELLEYISFAFDGNSPFKEIKITDYKDSFDDQLLNSRSLALNSEGGFLLTVPNSSTLIKYNPDNTVEWQKHYLKPYSEIKSIIRTRTGDYLTTGVADMGVKESNKLFLMKINKNGDVIWTKVYNKKYLQGKLLKEVSDGYLITSLFIYKSEGNTKYARYLIMKVDLDGNFKWERDIDNMFINDFTDLEDGSYMICGRKGQEAGFARLSYNGDFMSEKTYKNVTGTTNRFTSILKSEPDNSLYLVKSLGVNSRAQLYKINFNGDIFWKRDIDNFYRNQSIYLTNHDQRFIEKENGNLLVLSCNKNRGKMAVYELSGANGDIVSGKNIGKRASSHWQTFPLIFDKDESGAYHLFAYKAGANNFLSLIHNKLEKKF